jgi:hypothetical protein
MRWFRDRHGGSARTHAQDGAWPERHLYGKLQEHGSRVHIGNGPVPGSENNGSHPRRAGVKMQLYWHFNASTSPPLETVPDSRVYVSTDQADNFMKCFVAFSDGKVVSDDKHADAGEIGRVGETYRRIRITSHFGNMQVLVTDGHLPYPFGYELTGYQVQDLRATLDKAKTAGVKILSAIYTTGDRTSTIVEFPGGCIAEIHSLTVH